ncbi:MAG: DUF2179 domain-containing protein [Phycisphaerales bacterium]|nr:DUF2179 domain-containing protein [Phycisphaerales bacterium]
MPLAAATEPSLLHATLVCVGIVLARVVDVSTGVLRTVAVIHGRRTLACALGFFEVLVWVLVVSQVIETVGENPWYAIAYAMGFAAGNFIGITLEGHFALGRQVVRVFTRNGPQMAITLRAEGLTVTSFDGEGRDGPVQMLFIETTRRGAPSAIERARAIDPACYYIVDDIRTASATSK